MKVTKIKYTLIVSIIFAISSYGQNKSEFSNKKYQVTLKKGSSNWLSPRKMTPLSFIQLVFGRQENLKFITIENDFPENWVTICDADTLMKLIKRKDGCKCFVNPYSSYLPTTENSDLGGYAIRLLKY